jgi:hypothetical protein
MLSQPALCEKYIQAKKHAHGYAERNLRQGKRPRVTFDIHPKPMESSRGSEGKIRRRVGPAQSIDLAIEGCINSAV